jgi:hypothetical protein
MAHWHPGPRAGAGFTQARLRARDGPQGQNPWLSGRDGPQGQNPWLSGRRSTWSHSTRPKKNLISRRALLGESEPARAAPRPPRHCLAAGSPPEPREAALRGADAPWHAFCEPSVPNLARSESLASARACLRAGSRIVSAPLGRRRGSSRGSAAAAHGRKGGAGRGTLMELVGPISERQSLMALSFWSSSTTQSPDVMKFTSDP